MTSTSVRCTLERPSNTNMIIFFIVLETGRPCLRNFVEYLSRNQSGNRHPHRSNYRLLTLVVANLTCLYERMMMAHKVSRVRGDRIRHHFIGSARDHDDRGSG